MNSTMMKAGLLAVFVAAGWTCFGGSVAMAQDADQSTVTPVPRDTEEWWVTRQAAVNDRIKQGNVDLLFIGDSITQGWEGGGLATWNAYYGDRNAANAGFSGDRTEHVLWRLDHGNIDGITPKLIVLMIGTNNAGGDSAEEIAEGIKAIIAKLRAKLPDAHILELAVFPRDEQPGTDNRDKLAKVNELIAAAAKEDAMVHFFDINRWFLQADGVLSKEVMPDALHPNEKGYDIWARAIEPKVAQYLGELSATAPPKGFISLYNGKDLEGWKGLVDDPEKRAAMTPEELAAKQTEADAVMNQHWKAQEEGVLLFDGNGSHLCTNRDYGDIEMLVDWKIESMGDSGLYLRGTPQVQIWDPAQWPQGSGGLYNNKIGPPDPLCVADNPIGTWNQFRIVMIGDKVTVYLNDKIVVDEQVLENYWNREKPLYETGQIELQAHGHKVWFKNIYLRNIPREHEWTPLFNGTDLTGWEPVDGPATAWGVEEGMLFTTGQGGGWLSTTQQYKDFELQAEFRVPVNGNSGMFIRAPRTGNPAFEGSEIQVLDDAGSEYTTLEPWQYTGSVYHTAAPSRRVTKPAGEWQQMRIRAEGPHVTVWVNGFNIVDTNLNDHLAFLKDHPGLTRTEGYLGLQNHGSRLDYRNIQVYELNK